MRIVCSITLTARRDLCRIWII